ncbi:hypothetical protein EKK97_14410 [Billgrantia tianxiuensis]|uniref:Uncharacterized protein n=1 Tax=Billgrantia tianxiuensis TaxID=2497861 RepID=A0A6I6SMU5_9GAMM|nr:hypothetical protein [Halomonas tianxiuensis]QHC50551.1 hypothetical protein EKK97_14410 [Halomonas tianxiuensis]
MKCRSPRSRDRWRVWHESTRPGSARGAGQGGTPAKLALLEALKDTIPDGTRWALRGGKSGLAAWLAADTVKDLDLWVHSQDIRPFVRALAPIAVGTVSLESDPRWLRHLVLVMPQRFGGNCWTSPTETSESGGADLS